MFLAVSEIRDPVVTKPLNQALKPEALTLKLGSNTDCKQEEPLSKPQVRVCFEIGARGS